MLEKQTSLDSTTITRQNTEIRQLNTTLVQTNKTVSSLQDDVSGTVQSFIFPIHSLPSPPPSYFPLPSLFSSPSTSLSLPFSIPYPLPRLSSIVERPSGDNSEREGGGARASEGATL